MPKNCAICKKRTEGVPTFAVTQKRKDNWEYVIPNSLLVGDRICQTHFPESFLITENALNCPKISNRTRVSIHFLDYF